MLNQNQNYYFGPRESDRRKRKNGTERKVFAVNEMTELHHEISRQILLGGKNVDIAEGLNCTPQTVSNVRNSPVVQAKLSEMVKERDDRAVNIIEEVNKRLPRALEILDEALYDETGELPLSMRLKEANTLLDRKEKIEGLGQRYFHAHAMLSQEDIDNIKERALKVGRTSGVIYSEASALPQREASAPEANALPQREDSGERSELQIANETSECGETFDV